MNRHAGSVTSPKKKTFSAGVDAQNEFLDAKDT